MVAPAARAEVRIARVVRTPPAEVARAARGHELVLDVLHAGVRIGIAAGADRETLVMVLDVLGLGGAR